MTRDEYLDLMEERDDLFLEHHQLIENGGETDEEEALRDSILEKLEDLKDQMSEYEDNWF